MTDFDADYYERGESTGKSLYTDYRWMPELTKPMVEEIVSLLGLRKDDAVLDFGCAKGYVVRAFRELGFERVFGVDVSEYAINSADPVVADYLRQGSSPAIFNLARWNTIIAKDVLEHIEEADLADTVASMFWTQCVGGTLFVVVPLGDGERYLIPDMELDTTHKIRRPLHWWVEEIEAAGYSVTRAGTSFGTMKERWSDYPDGHGFIVAKRFV